MYNTGTYPINTVTVPVPYNFNASYSSIVLSIQIHNLISISYNKKNHAMNNTILETEKQAALRS
jgi:hypothetical protein